MKAWYFSTNDKKLRYGDKREIVAGKMHTVRGEPILCEYGLHASERVLDALGYAPGPYVWYVDVSRKLDVGKDKVCGQRRQYLWGFDAEDLLREFARKQALINVEKIKPYTEDYDLIVNYLTTGGEQIRPAARSAAWSAARSAAWSAAESAAWSAAESAAESAAWSAARSAARSAAWSAAESAARSAARSAAWSAANDMLEQMVMDKAKELGYV